MEDIYHPGPRIPSLLHQQNIHRSENVWNGVDTDEYLRVRKFDSSIFSVEDVHRRVRMIISKMGFYGVYFTSSLVVDNRLITALTERWRPETNSFHLPVGEASGILEDVGVLWGLPVDGDAVTGVDVDMSIQVRIEYCERWLGWTPMVTDIKGSRLRLGPLAECLNNKTIDSATSQHELEQYARGMLGGACIARLYRELGKASVKDVKEIVGPMQVLMLWARSRIKPIAPNVRHAKIETEQDLPPPTLGARITHGVSDHTRVGRNVLQVFRAQLDGLEPQYFIWRPYSKFDYSVARQHRKAVSNIFRARVPLVCFDVAKMYLPYRVLRQFVQIQNIPTDWPLNEWNDMHATHGRRGRMAMDSALFHAKYVQQWRNRRQCIMERPSGLETEDGYFD